VGFSRGFFINSVQVRKLILTVSVKPLILLPRCVFNDTLDLAMTFTSCKVVVRAVHVGVFLGSPFFLSPVQIILTGVFYCISFCCNLSGYIELKIRYHNVC
jgi:hypothetical protein